MPSSSSCWNCSAWLAALRSGCEMRLSTRACSRTRASACACSCRSLSCLPLSSAIATAVAVTFLAPASPSPVAIDRSSHISASPAPPAAAAVADAAAAPAPAPVSVTARAPAHAPAPALAPVPAPAHALAPAPAPVAHAPSDWHRHVLCYKSKRLYAFGRKQRARPSFIVDDYVRGVASHYVDAVVPGHHAASGENLPAFPTMGRTLGALCNCPAPWQRAALKVHRPGGARAAAATGSEGPPTLRSPEPHSLPRHPPPVPASTLEPESPAPEPSAPLSPLPARRSR
eukprot:scaffold8914_cov59-Phaeocystis_antarctica.AAC.1